MEVVVTNVRYWLAEHPTINGFVWEEGRTCGASLRFLAAALFTYLSLTSIIYYLTCYRNSTGERPSTSPSSTLRLISVVHSLILAVLSFIMAVGCTLSTLAQMPDTRWIFCFPANRTPPRGPVFFWAYVFYLSKILEFVDTLLILLSRSIKRLTFLHVYHHAVVLVMCYIWLHTSQSLVPVALVTNASVHTLMYAYYMLCALGVRPRWKRLVTDCQIVQFAFSFAVSVAMLWFHFRGGGEGCSGIWGWVFNAVFNGSLLVLFADFHASNYSKRGKERKKD